MKSWTLEAYCAENVFQIQPPICAVNFPSNMLKSDRTWHDLWNFLTINLKNKSFHNSIDSTGIYLQVYIPSRLAKFLWFTVSRFLESAFVKLPHPWHDLIINPLCGTGIPHKFAQKSLFPHVLWKSFLKKKVPPCFSGDTMPLLYWKIMWGYAFPQYLQICGLKSTYRICAKMRIVGWGIT